MDTLQLICLDLLYIKKLMDSPKPKFDNSFVDWIHMNIKHIPWSSIVDLQAKVVKGYRSVRINDSLNTYTEDILD